jgi:regulatory protein
VRASTRDQVRQSALAMLSRREHSVSQLIEKLSHKYDDIGICREVVAALSESGLQSDRRFAESWVRSRLHLHPESPSHMEAGLRQRGVREEDARSAVEQVLAELELDEEGLARRSAQRLVARGHRAAAQLISRLARRGFRYSIVRRIVEELTGRAPHSEF